MNYIWWYLSVKKMPNVSLKMARWRFVSNEIISAEFCQIHLIFVTFFKQFEFMLSWNQLKCDILSNFQIMCAPTFWSFRTSQFAPRKKVQMSTFGKGNGEIITLMLCMKVIRIICLHALLLRLDFRFGWAMRPAI